MKGKNAELFINGLAQLKPLVDKVETFEKDYEISRKKVLSEDLFWSEDKDEVYHVLREHDTVSSDYIKGLKKELQELMTLASTISAGYSSLDLVKEEK
jgi:hypothetical protein